MTIQSSTRPVPNAAPRPPRDWDAAYRAAGVLPYTVTLRKGKRTFAEPFWAFPALVDQSAASIASDFKATVVSVAVR